MRLGRPPRPQTRPELFDGDRDDLDHVEDHFWGRTASWVTRQHGEPGEVGDDVDPDAPTRPAGIERARRLRDSEAVARLNERFGFDTIDPLFTRIGMILLAALVAVPFVWATRDAEAEGVPPTSTAGAVLAPEDDPADSTPSSAAPPEQPAPPAAAAVPSIASAPTATPAPTVAVVTTTPAAFVVQANEVPATTLPPCGSTYTVRPGDSWSLVADRASIRMSDLLATNGATTRSMLYPDDEICLPPGARVVIPTTTAAPARANTHGSSGQSSAPATTAAPTTTVPLPPAPSAAEAEAIIREVWPDDVEERALDIARRESRLNANAQNWCCVGLFQIHWNAHKRWLAGTAITERRQLFDARTNASAAYALYERSGWSPWDL
jgi:LysM repeat protein